MITGDVAQGQVSLSRDGADARISSGRTRHPGNERSLTKTPAIKRDGGDVDTGHQCGDCQEDASAAGRAEAGNRTVAHPAGLPMPDQHSCRNRRTPIAADQRVMICIPVCAAAAIAVDTIRSLTSNPYNGVKDTRTASIVTRIFAQIMNRRKQGS